MPLPSRAAVARSLLLAGCATLVAGPLGCGPAAPAPNTAVKPAGAVVRRATPTQSPVPQPQLAFPSSRHPEAPDRPQIADVQTVSPYVDPSTSLHAPAAAPPTLATAYEVARNDGDVPVAKLASNEEGVASEPQYISTRHAEMPTLTLPTLSGPALNGPAFDGATPSGPPLVPQGEPLFPVGAEPARPAPVAAAPIAAGPKAAAPRPMAPRSFDPAALRGVSQQADKRVEEAFALARRGAVYAARSELILALQGIAQAADVLEAGNRRSQALADGMQAMQEAEDFFVRSTELEHGLDVSAIVAGHRTPVLKDRDLQGMSPLAALQQYYGYAQQQLAFSAANTPAGSRALYGLGKAHMSLAGASSDDQSHHTPKAMAMFQASLAADSGNHLAANELGVLLVQFGQLAEAKRALIHSVSVRPHAEGWRNLAVVHQRLGETDLAARAEHERELLASRSPAVGPQGVQWVNANELAAQGPAETLANMPAASTASKQQSGRSSTATWR